MAKLVLKQSVKAHGSVVPCSTLPCEAAMEGWSKLLFNYSDVNKGRPTDRT